MTQETAAAADEITVIDIADPQAVPMTLNPLEPAPGYPVQAHAERLAGLLEAAFRLAAPVAEALRAGLRRAYADCGWDMRTGAARPGAVTAPAVPSFRELKLAVLAAAAEMGYGPGMRAQVRGFLEARLDALWDGPAGRLLEGGHPADPARLLHGNVLVTGSGVAEGEVSAFLTGVLLLRLAEYLARRGRGRDGSRPAVVIASPDRLPGWLGPLLAEVRAAGADIIVAPSGPVSSGPVSSDAVSSHAVSSHAVSSHAVSSDAVVPLLSGRRSAACGPRCWRRPCDGYELHAAGLLADDPGQAWLRLWVQTLVLAFLTGRPVPRVPRPLRPAWEALTPRRRECLLATVIDAAVADRAAALRPCYEPRRLTAVIAVTASRMLAGDGIPVRAGSAWVIPQLRWLHEMERLNPLGQDSLRPDDIAPPLDFGLAGLPDWPGIRVADRLGWLRRHRLAMESSRNRELARTALLGAGGGAARASLDADLAVAGMGISPPLRLRHAAQTMGAGGHGRQPGWLEVVLSWPHRIIGPAAEEDLRRTGTG
jgi:uncharacterized protein